MLEGEGVPGGPRRGERGRRKNWGRLLLAVPLILILIAGIAGLPVYVYPRTDPLRPADAIFILGGYGEWDRRYYGFSLYQQGWAPNVVMSNPRAPHEKTWMDRWCESTTWGSDFLPNPTPWPTSTKFCLNPDPPTTLGEARAFRDLAEEQGWDTVIVVTIRPHIARARFIFDHCFSGDVMMAAIPARIPPSRWAYEYVYQTAGFVKALVAADC